MDGQRKTPDGSRDILYGRQAILESLKAGRRSFHGLRVADGIRAGGIASEILEAAQRRRVPVRACERRELDRLTEGGHHQGLALETGPYPSVELADLLGPPAQGGEPPFLLALDHVQDPQNVGSLMRTADAAGVQGVILPRDRASGVTAAVVRASSGAVEHLRVAVVVNLVRALEELKENNIWVYGLEAFPEATPHTAARLDGAVALVVGSEGEGLARLVRDTCDGLLRLPMRGRVGSLNAAVAGAIALYEIRRQRDARAEKQQQEA